MNSKNRFSNMNNQSASDNEQYSQITPELLLNAFCKLWWLCVILAILGIGIMFLKSYVLFTPVYQSSVTFTVQTPQIGTGNIGITSYSFSYNRSTAVQLSSTFPNIIKSNILQDIICNELNLDNFPCKLNASSVSGTNMFTITAEGKDPQITYDILQSVIKNYPTVAQYVIGDTNLDILTEPVIPTSPSNQFAYRSQIAKGAIAGFALGLVWIIIYAIFRQTICSRSDIRTKLNQHCLGTLPEVTFKKYNREINCSIVLTNPLLGDNYLESFRALRNSILNTSTSNENNVIMVTSTAPGEGKTSVAVNLALSLSMMNKKVIIVDGDIRNPNVNARLGLTDNSINTETNPIAKISQIKIDQNIILSVANFNTGEYAMWKLLDADHFGKFLDQLRSKYDYIIVDTSPLGITSEPAVVAQCVDTSILVIKRDTVRISRIVSTIDTLLSSNTKILGCVLNGEKLNMTGYGSYAYGYKKYGYGYNYGYGSSRKRHRNQS